MYASSSSLFLAHVTLVVNYTQEVQHVVLLLSELAKYQQTWRRTSPESILEFEEMRYTCWRTLAGKVYFDLVLSMVPI